MGPIRVFLFGATLLVCLVSSESACPNQDFLNKHYCQKCETPAQALQFTLKRKNTDPNFKGSNTVFVGEVKAWIPDKDLCSNQNPMSVFDCNISSNKPGCLPRAGWCFGKHRQDDGHLYFDRLKCKL